MIELIFVIVILGILASVAIPRLAGTREDAEISAAVANLRTLLSDAASYYAVKGDFKDAGGTNDAKWTEITSVPLKKGADGAAMDNTVEADTTAYLKVGNVNDCIGVAVVGKTTNAPAHIKFTLKQQPAGTGQTGTVTTTEGVCGKVLASKPVKAYIDSVVKDNTTNGIANAMAIGSNTSVYQ
ncbi:type II secretion system protein [Campylobacter magnus]|uniref:type II secretion system protein n=1 Tax=Campylobacter magnus TaxID=3026462 RepID=UPI0038505A46